MDDDFMGAIKIKDGLFIGDEFSAQVRKIGREVCLELGIVCD